LFIVLKILKERSLNVDEMLNRVKENHYNHLIPLQHNRRFHARWVGIQHCPWKPKAINRCLRGNNRLRAKFCWNKWRNNVL